MNSRVVVGRTCFPDVRGIVDENTGKLPPSQEEIETKSSTVVLQVGGLGGIG